MNTKKDIDTLLSEAMKTTAKPSKDLINETLGASVNILNQSGAGGSKRVRRFSVAAAVVFVSVLTMTVTALAFVGYQMGAFDRLLGIVGQEQADRLQPIEVISDIYEADNVVGEIITDEGIRIELVAVGVLPNVIDLYFTLEDMVGNRLDSDRIRIFSTVCPVTPHDAGRHGLARVQSPRIIDRTEDGVVTFRYRKASSYSFKCNRFLFRLHSIQYNLEEVLYEVLYEGRYESFYGEMGDEVQINWYTTFEVELPSEKELIASGLDVPIAAGSAIIREVRVTPTHIIIEGEYYNHDVPPRRYVFLNTTQGVISPGPGGFANHFDIDDDGNLLGPAIGFTDVRVLVDIFEFESAFEIIDLETVISIEIDGNVIALR